MVLIVLRLGKNYEYKNSRPCAHCIQILQKYGIHKVIYSNDIGGFYQEIVDDMDSKQAFITLGWKRIQKLIDWDKKFT